MSAKKLDLTAKLVHETSRQRFYKLNHKLLKGANLMGECDIVTELQQQRERRTKEQYRHLIPTDGLDLIVISDAHTHTERLVFGAIILDNGDYGAMPGVHIQGANTMMIHGGDSSTVKADEVYLRRLCQMNGFIFKGIK